MHDVNQGSRPHQPDRGPRWIPGLARTLGVAVVLWGAGLILLGVVAQQFARGMGDFGPDDDAQRLIMIGIFFGLFGGWLFATAKSFRRSGWQWRARLLGAGLLVLAAGAGFLFVRWLALDGQPYWPWAGLAVVFGWPGAATLVAAAGGRPRRHHEGGRGADE